MTANANPPLGDALDLFRRSIFRVQQTQTDPESGQTTELAIATAFVVGVYTEARHLVLATAGHVLDVNDPTRAEWLFVESDAALDPVRKASFSVPHDETRGKLFHRHHHTDVGVMVIPAGAGWKGERFVRDDEKPLPLIAHSDCVTTGTRVAWAGYAFEVEKLFSTPCLCYFEGNISLLVDRPDAAYYIIDGHNTHGVSGGPVWHWNEKLKRFEVVAIISSYKLGDAGLPGFVIAEPIRHVTGFLGHMMQRPDVTITVDFAAQDLNGA